MTENKYTYIYYELRNMLVLYIDDGYALSWLVDFVNRNNNIKHIDKIYEDGFHKIIIHLKDNSTITMLKCYDIEDIYNYLRGNRYNRIYVDSSIELTTEQSGWLENLIAHMTLCGEKTMKG